MPVTRHSPIKDARARLGQMRARMAALCTQQTFLADLAETSREAAPPADRAVWPSDIAELASKIQRQDWGGLRPLETPVRSKDREIVLAGLPPCYQVQRNEAARCR